MRIATLILGLVLTIGLFLQSALVATAESIADALDEEETQSDGGGVGILVSLGFLIASALVIAKPRFAMWTFAGSAVVAFIGGASTDFSDLYVWGIVGLVLAAMAWRGSVEKRRSDALEQEQREQIATLARAAEASQQTPLPPQ
jgi:hypothetical protein